MIKPKTTPKKYLFQSNAGRWYFRKIGKYTPIDAEHGTAKFDAIYWAITAGKGQMAAPPGRCLMPRGLNPTGVILARRYHAMLTAPQWLITICQPSCGLNGIASICSPMTCTPCAIVA